MVDQKLIPELRFPEFEDYWKEKKLGEVFINSRKKGNNVLPIYSVSQSSGLVPRESLDRSIQKDARSDSNLAVDEGDLVYNMMRMWQGAIGIAKTNCMVSPAYVVLKPKKGELSQFHLQMFSKPRSLYLFWAYSYGLTNDRLRLYFKDFASIKRIIPSPAEQQKIASFFTAIDKRIKLLEEKKKQLERYKQGIMQKIFSQEIKFKDQDGNDFPDWIDKRLGDVLTVGSGRDYKHLDEGNIPVYGTGGYMLSVDGYLFEGESVCIGRKGTIDKPMFLSGKFWTVDTLFYTHSYVGVLPFFVFLLFQQINWQKHNEASGVPSLSKATIEKIKVAIPPAESEQQKIVSFISSLDESIEKLSDQIEGTDYFKKGLLQKMFV